MNFKSVQECWRLKNAENELLCVSHSCCAQERHFASFKWPPARICLMQPFTGSSLLCSSKLQTCTSHVRQKNIIFDLKWETEVQIDTKSSPGERRSLMWEHKSSNSHSAILSKRICFLSSELLNTLFHTGLKKKLVIAFTVYFSHCRKYLSSTHSYILNDVQELTLIVTFQSVRMQ